MIHIVELILLKSRSYLSYLRFILKLKFGRFNKIQAQEKVVTLIFVGDILQARIPRLLQAIQGSEKDYSLNLWLCNSNVSSNFSLGLDVPTKLFSNAWEILIELKRFDNKKTIIHFFEPKASTARTIHKYILEAKCLVDFQDVYSTYYGINPPIRWMKKQVLSESYILNHFSNILSNSLEINHACRLHKAKPENRLFFLPYCETSYFQDSVMDLNGNYSLVYAGGITGTSHENQQDSAITNLMPLANILEKKKIPFHIFPSPNVGNNILEEYQKLSLKSSYFQLEKSINQADLAKKLTRFQFGILPFFEKGSWKGSAKMKYAISLKLFNFIEAGIPIIVSSDIEFQAWLIKRYQLGIVVSSEEEIATTIENMNSEMYSLLVSQVKKNRMVLSLNSNISRLMQFYSNLK